MRDFVPEYHHANFGGNWTTNKGETEGAQWGGGGEGGAQNYLLNMKFFKLVLSKGTVHKNLARLGRFSKCSKKTVSIL